MMRRVPGFISRKFFKATGLETPSQRVWPSRCKSAKEYSVGSVFSKYSSGMALLAPWRSELRYCVNAAKSQGFLRLDVEPDRAVSKRTWSWVRPRSARLLRQRIGPGSRVSRGKRLRTEEKTIWPSRRASGAPKQK